MTYKKCAVVVAVVSCTHFLLLEHILSSNVHNTIHIVQTKCSALFLVIVVKSAHNFSQCEANHSMTNSLYTFYYNTMLIKCDPVPINKDFMMVYARWFLMCFVWAWERVRTWAWLCNVRKAPHWIPFSGEFQRNYHMPFGLRSGHEFIQNKWLL